MSKTNGTIVAPTVVVKENLYADDNENVRTGGVYRIPRVEDSVDPEFWRSTFEGRRVDVRYGSSRSIQDVLTLRYLPPNFQEPLKGLLWNFASSFSMRDADKRVAQWLVDTGSGFRLSEPVEWHNEEAVEAALKAMGVAKQDEETSIREVALVLVFSLAVAIQAYTSTFFQNVVRRVLASNNGRQAGSQFLATLIHATPFEASPLRGMPVPTVDNALIFRTVTDSGTLTTPGPSAAPAPSSGGAKSGDSSSSQQSAAPVSRIVGCGQSSEARAASSSSNPVSQAVTQAPQAGALMMAAPQMAQPATLLGAGLGMGSVAMPAEALSLL